MKIGIDGIFLNNLNTGTGQYTYNLIKALNGRDTINDYIIFSPYDNTLDFVLNSNFQWKLIKTANCGLNINKITWEQYYVPRAAKETKIDELHTPYMSFPFFLNAKHIATVFDIIAFRYRAYRKKIKWRLYYYLVGLRIKKTDGLLTVSEYSKNAIITFFQLNDSKVHVVYPGFEYETTDAGELNIRNKFDLSKKFILYVGSDEYRKNLSILIEAYKKISIANRNIYDLVLVGSESKSNVDGVKSIGIITREELISFYKAATLFVYPSMYEGFGLPVLEAMCYGVPVIASNTTSIPEVVQDAAFLVSPHDSGQISRAMDAVLHDCQLRKNLVEKGKRRAAVFTFEKFADETINFYNQIGSEK